MAHLDMEVDMWHASQNTLDPEENFLLPPSSSVGHWTLGSPGARVSSHGWELHQKSTDFRNFDMRLREYIAHHHLGFGLRHEDDIEVCCIISFISRA